MQNRVFNYYSTSDKVLKFFYATVEGGHAAAGHAGMKTKLKKIENVNVTKDVDGHSDYVRKVSLR